MKADQKKQLQQSSVADLEKKLRELEKTYVINTAEIKMGKQANVKAAWATRKQIAVIKTILTQKQQTAS